MEFDDEAQDGEDIIDQMQNIGYEANNCILNLGTLYFLIAIYFIEVVGTIFLALFTKCSGRAKQLFAKKIKQLFFAEILILSIEGFIELYISGYL